MKFNYKIKQKKEDFVVNEISLQPDLYHCNKSNFSYLWIEKRGMTTFDALDEIKKVFNLNHKDISAQGLKDEDGVTSQLISVRKIIFQKDLELFNKKFTLDDYKLQIKSIKGYGKKSLVPRLLHGNNFKLVIRNLDQETAQLFYNYCENNRFVSFFNYYDNQRFGIVGGPYNTHLIGKAITDGDWITAYKEFKKSKNSELANVKKPIEINYVNCQKFFKQINFAKIRFFISSYNSHLWNKKASDYIDKIKGGTFQHSFSEIGLLSLIKNKTFQVHNVLSVSGYEIDKNTYKTVPKEFTRNLLVTTTAFPVNIGQDELNKDKHKVQVSFFLPTGCYATMLIKQIFLKLNV
jgi:tRNA pseudouridine13 synthase